jgi:predicted Zn-dependent protease
MERFYALAEQLFRRLQGGEVLLLALHGEESDFVRFNHARIRQAGQVRQRRLRLDLIDGARHAQALCDLGTDTAADLKTAANLLQRLRAGLPNLPADPHLHYATLPDESCHQASPPGFDAGDVAAAICDAAADLDLVGIWAGGPCYQGYAASLGQRHWQSAHSFHFDWSCYLHDDKAVKASYAGSDWDAVELRRRLDRCRQRLALLEQPAKALRPGEYSVFFAPRAVTELLDLMAWGGFGARDRHTRTSAFMGMLEGETTLSPRIELSEHHGRGLLPIFTSQGFVKPQRIPLISGGYLDQPLVDARSAREYDLAVNCEHEQPDALELGTGTLPRDQAMEALGTGIYVSDLWYGNFADRNAFRITAMTRFASLWVEHGQPVAPAAVLRMDDSIYHLLGDGLRDLTRERDLLLDAGSYNQRSGRSWLVPGLLVDKVRFTL